MSKERAVYWGRHAQGDSSAGSVKRGSSISGPEACVCVQEFCPERTGKELNKYTSKKQGNVSTLGVIFFFKGLSVLRVIKHEFVYRMRKKRASSLEETRNFFANKDGKETFQRKNSERCWSKGHPPIRERGSERVLSGASGAEQEGEI